jgi:HSP20 family protein
MYHKHFGYDNAGHEAGPAFFKQMAHRCGGGHWGRHAGGHWGRGGVQHVPVNIRETEQTFELHVFAPGLQKTDFTISVAGQELIIGYRAAEQKGEQENWLRNEYRRGSFERRFQLTERIDTENISAAYTDGVLVVTLPKLPGFSAPKQDIAVA